MKERNPLLIAAAKILDPMTRQCSIWRLIHAYLYSPHAPHRTLPSRFTRAKLKLLAKILADFYQVKFVKIQHLQFSRVDALKSYIEAQPLSNATCQVLLSLYLSLLRFAAKRGIIHDAIEHPSHQQKPVRRKALIDGDGTLWEICQRYFAVNVRIRHEHTRHQYRIALRDFAEFLGHPGKPADLCDDNVAGMQKMLLTRGCAPKTANERRGRINTLWTWMAKRRIVEMFPTNYKVPEPRRLPTAWTADQLRAIYRAAAEQPGRIAGIPASEWWTALLLTGWDTGERISALLAVEWDALDWSLGRLFIRAEIRKGQAADMDHPLHADTLAALAAIDQGSGPLFPWDRSVNSIWRHYKKILIRAGLPHGRRDMFHRLRRSVASHLEAAGVNSTAVMGHSTREITERSYIDRRIARVVAPADVLFRIGGDQ